VKKLRQKKYVNNAKKPTHHNPTIVNTAADNATTKHIINEE